MRAYLLALILGLTCLGGLALTPSSAAAHEWQSRGDTYAAHWRGGSHYYNPYYGGGNYYQPNYGGYYTPSYGGYSPGYYSNPYSGYQNYYAPVSPYYSPGVRLYIGR
jgi:hypothetical protein